MEITKTRIKEIVNEVVYDQQNINDSDRLREDIGMDSLDVIDLSLKIELELGITISDSEAEGFNTVQDVYEVLEKLNVTVLND